MTNESALLAVIQNCKTVSVVFEGAAKRYTYKVPADWDVKVDDTLVVDSPFDGYTCVKVVAVHEQVELDFDAVFKYKWAVQKVDDADYAARLEQERVQEADLKKLVRRAAIKKQMQKLALELEDAGELPESLAGLKEWL